MEKLKEITGNIFKIADTIQSVVDIRKSHMFKDVEFDSFDVIMLRLIETAGIVAVVWILHV